MRTLRQVLQDAQKNNQIVWHINVASYEQLEAVARVSQKKQMPFLVGVSEGEREAWGVARIADLVKVYRAEGVEIFLNADHTHSLEKIQEAVNAGFDEVLFDAGKKDLPENIALTKEVVAWVKSYNVNHKTDILVEGEVGYIGSSSVELDTLPTDLSAHTTVADAQMFCAQTGIDLFAPAVGNIHGMLKNQSNPLLNIDRITELTRAVTIPLVLHGGSGTPIQSMREAIRAGIRVIHISTEIRIAWRNALEQTLANHPRDIVPYHILPEVIRAIEFVIEEKIKQVYTENN